jgi:hypothetical protein
MTQRVRLIATTMHNLAGCFVGTCTVAGLAIIVHVVDLACGVIPERSRHGARWVAAACTIVPLLAVAGGAWQSYSLDSWFSNKSLPAYSAAAHAVLMCGMAVRASIGRIDRHFGPVVGRRACAAALFFAYTALGMFVGIAVWVDEWTAVALFAAAVFVWAVYDVPFYLTSCSLEAGATPLLLNNAV